MTSQNTTSSNTVQTVFTPRLFDGKDWLYDIYLTFQAGKVLDLTKQKPPGSRLIHTVPDHAFLAPGLVDLQINGGGNVLFSDNPTEETLATIGKAHLAAGTTSFMPTLISPAFSSLRQALNCLSALKTKTDKVFTESSATPLGLHAEGPFLNPRFRGIHPESAVRLPSAEDITLLTGAYPFPVMLTLAPECLSKEQLTAFLNSPLFIFIGHSAADFTQITEAFSQRARGITHLFNAMPPLSARQTNAVPAFLQTPGVFAGLIADNLHVAAPLMKLPFMLNPDGVFLVSDAMPTTGGTLSSFTLDDTEVFLSGEQLKNRNGTLGGAHLPLFAGLRTIRALSLPGQDTLTLALKAATLTPAACLGLQKEIGRLTEGTPADFIEIADRKTPDHDLYLLKVSKGGKFLDQQTVPEDLRHFWHHFQ